MTLLPGREDAVFDLLYVDARRVALFLSQFGQYGHLTSLERSTTGGSTASGELDLKLARFGGGANQQTTLSRQYDAQWIAPLAFLKQAEERGMMVARLAEARVGQIALASGTLTVRDLGLFGKALKLPSFKQRVREDGISPNLSQKERKAELSNRDVGIELVSVLPHAIHAEINGTDFVVWSILQEENMVGASGDLLLKHGVTVQGTWTIIGIVDALPDAEQLKSEVKRAMSGEWAAGLAHRMMGAVLDYIGPIGRALLGRPGAAFGMTPLLIFREIAR